MSRKTTTQPPPAPPVRTEGAAGSALAWIVPVAAAVLFAVIKLPSLRPQLSDENIYFYMGRLVAEGYVPYRDFFYSGPPLLPYVLAIPGLLAPKTFLAYKIVPLLGSAAMVGVYAATLQRAWGRPGALAGALALLLSASFLRATSHATGINLAMLGVWASALLLLQRRPAWSGVAFTLGVGSKLLACTAAPALVVLVLWTAPPGGRKRVLVRWGIGAAAMAGAVFLPFLILAPQGFYHGMVQYHFLKVARPERSAEIWAGVLSSNTWLLGAAVVAVVLVLVLRKARDPLALSLLLYAVFHIGFLLAQKRMWSFYFDPVVPVLAALAGFAWFAAERAIASPRRRWALRAVALLLLAWPATAHVLDDLDHEGRYLRVARPMADYLRETAAPGATLFGDSASAPLVALLSGVPVAAREVDTNVMRFTSGASDLSTVLDSAKADQLTYLIVRYVSEGPRRRPFGVIGFRECRSLLSERPLRQFDNPGKGTFAIYECSPSTR